MPTYRCPKHGEMDRCRDAGIGGARCPRCGQPVEVIWE